jgi:hypothetical protein
VNDFDLNISDTFESLGFSDSNISDTPETVETLETLETLIPLSLLLSCAIPSLKCTGRACPCPVCHTCYSKPPQRKFIRYTCNTCYSATPAIPATVLHLQHLLQCYTCYSATPATLATLDKPNPLFSHLPPLPLSPAPSQTPQL